MIFIALLLLLLFLDLLDSFEFLAILSLGFSGFLFLFVLEILELALFIFERFVFEHILTLLGVLELQIALSHCFLLRLSVGLVDSSFGAQQLLNGRLRHLWLVSLIAVLGRLLNS